MLRKGIRAFVEGRLQTKSWQGTDGAQKQRTEIVISDMIILEPKRVEGETIDVPADFGAGDLPEAVKPEAKKETVSSKKAKSQEKPETEEDIPF